MSQRLVGDNILIKIIIIAFSRLRHKKIPQNVFGERRYDMPHNAFAWQKSLVAASRNRRIHQYCAFPNSSLEIADSHNSATAIYLNRWCLNNFGETHTKSDLIFNLRNWAKHCSFHHLFFAAALFTFVTFNRFKMHKFFSIHDVRANTSYRHTEVVR